MNPLDDILDSIGRKMGIPAELMLRASRAGYGCPTKEQAELLRKFPCLADILFGKVKK